MPLRHFTLLILRKMSVFWSKNESRIPQSILNNVFVLSFKKLKLIMLLRHFSLLILIKMSVFLWKNEVGTLKQKASSRTSDCLLPILVLPFLGQKWKVDTLKNPKIPPCFYVHESHLFSIDKLAISKIKNIIFGAKMKSGYSKESQNSALFFGLMNFFIFPPKCFLSWKWQTY